MAAAQDDPEFRQSFRDQFIEPRRAALRAVLERAVQDRRLDGAGLDAAVIALFGAVWYRLLLDEPVDATFADRLASMVVAGLNAGNQ